MFAYCRNNPVKRKDVTGTSDILYTDGDDDNPLDDLGYPGGGGGGGGTSCSYTGYAYAYNPIDAGYSYHVSFDVAMYSSLYTGGIYQLGYDAFEVYSNPTSTSSTSTSTTPSACFIAGTLVQSEDGAVAIEHIAVGDMVWAWDETTGDVALKEVVETYINQSDELIHVFVNGEEIITTPTHPFYSPMKGWTAAAKLRAGDILVLVNGKYVVVEKVQHEILEAPITVYNFQVEGYHTYFVANTGVLVHNDCEKPTSPVKVDDRYIKHNNIDAHAFKRIAGGVPKNMIARYDIYKDTTNNGQLWVGTKNRTDWRRTDYVFEELSSEWTKE